ncbi:hypothetical protein LFM09_38720 [Lentzea alba]|uniref:hypothetical protein n=1 Tax=Lentzea alba TaxID=2714351 RepID=UPI0039BFB547
MRTAGLVVVGVITGWVCAVLLGLAFGGAVADRFGLLGAPGSEGVAWGDWRSFTVYTGQPMPWAPEWLVPLAAVGATAAEIALFVWLISGPARKWAVRCCSP